MSSRNREGDMAGVAPAPPCAMVIFGAGGDLTKRLLIPSLYNLLRADLLPERLAIIGVARAERDREAFRRDLGDSLRAHATDAVLPEAWDWLSERLYYCQGDLESPVTFERLAEN